MARLGETRVRARTGVAIAGIGLGLLAALVYGDHVLRGGLLWDDWENAATSHYHYEQGFLGPFDLRQAAYRPVLQLLLPLPHLVFGSSAPWHLALALMLAVAAATAFYALLLALGAHREFALGAAALALVFPWSDSTRLWATASLNLVALVLFFTAATVAVRRPRERVRLTAFLLAAAVLTYEAVAGLVLLLPLLYSLRMPWREALRRWRVEAAAAGVAALLVALLTTKTEGGGIAHAAAIARDGALLLGRALAPWDVVPPIVALVAATAVVTALAARGVDVRPVLIALAALALAWAPFVPGEDKYVPSAAGVYDRVNIVAGFAIAALVCSLVTLMRGRALQIAAVVAVGIGWAAHARDHVNQYSRAAAARTAALAAIEHAAPRPAPGTVMVVLEPAAWEAPGVPVFAHSWDLGGALKLRYDDASIGGYPVTPGTSVRCGRRGLVAGAGPTPYSRALVIDTVTATATRVRNARECRSAVRPRPGSA